MVYYFVHVKWKGGGSMAMEIEKITLLIEKCDEEEKKEVTSVKKSLSDTFRLMITDFQNYVLSGKREDIDMEGIIPQLKRLKEIGAKYQVEFPSIDDADSARVYVAQYGSQIVKMG